MRFSILILFVFLFVFSVERINAQVDLLSLINEEPKQKEYVSNAFKSTRVIMSHSIESLGAGVLDFRILHRFGMFSRGPYEFYGLDQASIRLGLDYGISDRLSVGIGRGSYKKEVDGFVKYKLFWQSKGPGSFPLSVVYIVGTTVNGLKWQHPERQNYFTSRMAYYHQLLIGRKFSQRLTLQLAPTLVHQNLVPDSVNRHDIYAVEAGGRIKITRRLALNVDYFYVLRGKKGDINYTYPLSIGFDIETGGHVFQVHFTNATGMNERAFITDTKGKWEKGDVQIGFNISRVFTIADKRSKK
jgi:hypothetical protein